MLSSKITQHLCRSIFPSHFITRRVLLQSPNFTLRNSRPILFQSLPYANTNSLPLPKDAKSSPPPPKDANPSPPPPKESTYLDRFTKFAFFQLPTAILARLIFSGLIGLMSLDLIYAWYRNRCNERLLIKTIENGTKPDIDIPIEEYVLRSLVTERLKTIFKPNKNHSFYHMVCGEHGTGKTTLIKDAAKQVGQGVIYIDIPPNPSLEDFGIAFGKALNFKFEEHISFTTQLMKKILGNVGNASDASNIGNISNLKNDKLFIIFTQDKPEKWKRALATFKRIGELYKKKYDRLPVIVFDNVSRLIANHSEIVDTLQDDAKDNVDRSKYTAVFVTSEGSIPRRMKLRSAWSRATPPIEIGDLTREEAFDYLIKKKKIDVIKAENLYDLIGGRILELMTAVDLLSKGYSVEAIKVGMYVEISDKLKAAKLHENYKYHEVGKRIFSVLLDSKELESIEFEKFFDNPDDANEVLEKNIFAYHPEKDTVTFQSRSVECYIRDKASIFINNNKN